MSKEKPIIYCENSLPPSYLLRKTSEEYEKNLLDNRLTAESVRKYWQTTLSIYGRKADLDIIVPPFEGSQEELSAATSHGIEPIPVPTILAGPEGIDNLRTMYRGEMTIPSLPRITNTGKDVWCYVVTDPTVSQEQLKEQFPDQQSEGMNFQRRIISAAHIKRLTRGALPDSHRVSNINNTTSRLTGSMIEANLLVNENKKPDVPGVSFNKRDVLIMTRLSNPPNPQQEFANIITRLQTPVRPRKVAPR